MKRPVMYINGKLKVEIPEFRGWNQCPTCGEIFESITSFDTHRHGDYGKDRRCMDATEMIGAGMSKNKRDRWVCSEWEERFKTENKDE